MAAEDPIREGQQVLVNFAGATSRNELALAERTTRTAVEARVLEIADREGTGRWYLVRVFAGHQQQFTEWVPAERVTPIP